MSALWHITVIDQELPTMPFVRKGGSLLMMVGLPGAGKSYIVEHLSKLVDAVVIRTDEVRLKIRNSPRYTHSEMVWVYEVCQKIIELRLRRGQRVIFDGTNFQAARRERFFNVARRRDAAIAVAYVQAAEEVIRQRLTARNNGLRREGDLSDADWSVYQWMVHAQEPITRPHKVLDTTSTPPDVLARSLRDYWIEQESAHVPGTHHLQSERRTGPLSAHP